MACLELTEGTCFACSVPLTVCPRVLSECNFAYISLPSPVLKITEIVMPLKILTQYLVYGIKETIIHVNM